MNMNLTHTLVVRTGGIFLNYSFSKGIDKVAEAMTTIGAGERFLLGHGEIRLR